MKLSNVKTLAFHSLLTTGVIMGSLTAIQLNLVLAQSSASDRIDCIKKFRDFYYSQEGGNLSSRDALAKAEQTCAEESNQNRKPSNPVPGDSWRNSPSGAPTAIADCMKRLMYERKLVCTRIGFPGCSSFPSEGFAGWQTQNVRTEISEAAAVQACQNAR